MQRRTKTLLELDRLLGVVGAGVEHVYQVIEVMNEVGRFDIIHTAFLKC